MKVKELIELLSEFDPDAEVFTGGMGSICEVDGASVDNQGRVVINE